jgi:hypothetical protein
MMKRPLLCAALALALLCALPAAPQDGGYWRASSSNAKSTTGDIAFSSSRLVINFAGFPLAQIRALKPTEATLLFDLDNAGGSGDLYRLDIPATKQFLHHNTLCGSEDAQWVVTWVQGRTLQLAIFSGAAMPQLTPEVLTNDAALCGVFTYTR